MSRGWLRRSRKRLPLRSATSIDRPDERVRLSAAAAAIGGREVQPRVLSCAGPPQAYEQLTEAHARRRSTRTSPDWAGR